MDKSSLLFYLITYPMGLGSTVGKYIAIVVGLAFYVMSLSALLDVRAQKQQTQTLFNAVDRNGDGKLTRKEVENFELCEDSPIDKFRNKMDGIGKRVSLHEFQDAVTPKNIKQYMASCADGAQIYSSPEKLAQLDAPDIAEDYFELYDLNGDGGILWSEYSFVNSFNKKSSDRARDTFKFLDKLRDWKITTKEFTKAKLSKLMDADTGRRRRHKK